MADSSPTTASDNNLQPFFVLHKASSPKKSAPRTRRKIDLSPKKSSNLTDEHHNSSRYDTFKFLWSRTESSIRVKHLDLMDALNSVNSDVFNKVQVWVRASFDAFCARQKLDFASATSSYPILNNVLIGDAVASRKIPTVLLFTKNMEFVDDVQTFSELAMHLRSSGCYVANLTSSDFSVKGAIGGCLKTLLRQFLLVNVEAPEMSVLASWYHKQENSETPLVVIIDDVEKCCSSVLIDFIIMLREWVTKVPVILILGVATNFDALRSTLSCDACACLSFAEFRMSTPAERMDAVIEAVLVKECGSLSIGKKVADFLRNHFLRHDGTLTLFIRALKIAVVQHVYLEPLTFALEKLIDNANTKGFEGDIIFCKVSDSCNHSTRSFQSGTNYDDLANGFTELKKVRKLWSSAVMCINEVGKYHKMSLLDVYCEMLEPDSCKLNGSNSRRLASEDVITSNNYHQSGHLQTELFVVRALGLVRDLPAMELQKLLKSWEMLTSSTTVIHEKINELQSLTISSENHQRRDPTDAFKRPTLRNHRTDKSGLKEKVATFLQSMIKEYVQPIESIPFNELVFFNNIDKLQALIGDPRRRIQADLLESHRFLKCSCCVKSGGNPCPSMHDTSMMYSLAQEHGDLINLHEWFHSFKSILSQPPAKAKKRLKTSPSPRKRKSPNEVHNRSDASIQAAFCRAVMELQITGLLRMPSKRRPDFVQRVAFGL